jgi:hypothetical protein
MFYHSQINISVLLRLSLWLFFMLASVCGNWL